MGILLLILYTQIISLKGEDSVISTNIAQSANTAQESCDTGKDIKTIWWSQEPYVFTEKDKTGIKTYVRGIIAATVKEMVSSCCVTGTQMYYSLPIERQKNGLENIIKKTQHNFIFPVATRSGKSTLYGRDFVPVIESPGVAVMIKQNVSGSDLLTAILSAWPILIFVVMTASLSGIMIWVLDFKANSEEFPEFFPLGVFEGFWWASVTMTTVGYGDKSPRSIPARLFAVVWITVGLVILAMFMGIVTTSLTASNLEGISNLYGQEVAVVNDTVEQKLAIIQSADIKVVQTIEQAYEGVGLGLYQLSAVDYYSSTQHEDYHSKHGLAIGSIIDHTISYGIVLPYNTTKLSSCFSRYLESNSKRLYQLMEKFIIPTKTGEEGKSAADEYFNGGIFGLTIYGMLGLFLLILAIGLSYQFLYLPRIGEAPSAPTEGIDNRALEMSDIKNKEQKLNPDIEAPDVTVNGRSLSRQSVSSLGNEGSSRSERLMTQQSMEMLRMEEEYERFRKNWERNLKAMQERHRKQQSLLFTMNYGSPISRQSSIRSVNSVK